MDFDVEAFLKEPKRPASVATVTAGGRPALATMWYLFADDRFWLHSPRGSGPFIRAATNHEPVAVMVETFDPTGRVIQVRATGPAAIEGDDHDRIHQIYDRYLGPDGLWSDGWRRQTVDPTFALWSTKPVSGVAVQFPELHDAGGDFRWSSSADFRMALRAARGR